MLILGLLVWFVVLAVYGAIWLGLVALVCRVQRTRKLSLRESDGTGLLFLLRVIVLAMVLFPVLDVLIYVPSTVDAVVYTFCKPRLVEDMGDASLLAMTLALLSSCCAWLLITRRASARPHP